MSEAIAQTIQAFDGLITRPTLTTKLLQKPPFRFLCDIVISLQRSTKFPPVALFGDEERIPDLITGRESRMTYLTKVIRAVEIASGEKIEATAANLVAGIEDEAIANVFLRTLAEAAKKSGALNLENIADRVRGEVGMVTPPSSSTVSAGPRPRPPPLPKALPSQVTPRPPNSAPPGKRGPPPRGGSVNEAAQEVVHTMYGGRERAFTAAIPSDATADFHWRIELGTEEGEACLLLVQLPSDSQTETLQLSATPLGLVLHWEKAGGTRISERIQFADMQLPSDMAVDRGRCTATFNKGNLEIAMPLIPRSAVKMTGDASIIVVCPPTLVAVVPIEIMKPLRLPRSKHFDLDRHVFLQSSFSPLGHDLIDIFNQLRVWSDIARGSGEQVQGTVLSDFRGKRYNAAAVRVPGRVSVCVLIFSVLPLWRLFEQILTSFSSTPLSSSLTNQAIADRVFHALPLEAKRWPLKIPEKCFVRQFSNITWVDCPPTCEPLADFAAISSIDPECFFRLWLCVIFEVNVLVTCNEGWKLLQCLEMVRSLLLPCCPLQHYYPVVRDPATASMLLLSPNHFVVGYVGVKETQRTISNLDASAPLLSSQFVHNATRSFLVLDLDLPLNQQGHELQVEALIQSAKNRNVEIDFAPLQAIIRQDDETKMTSHFAQCYTSGRFDELQETCGNIMFTMLTCSAYFTTLPQCIKVSPAASGGKEEAFARTSAFTKWAEYVKHHGAAVGVDRLFGYCEGQFEAHSHGSKWGVKAMLFAKNSFTILCDRKLGSFGCEELGNVLLAPTTTVTLSDYAADPNLMEAKVTDIRLEFLGESSSSKDDRVFKLQFKKKIAGLFLRNLERLLGDLVARERKRPAQLDSEEKFATPSDENAFSAPWESAAHIVLQQVDEDGGMKAVHVPRLDPADIELKQLVARGVQGWVFEGRLIHSNLRVAIKMSIMGDAEQLEGWSDVFYEAYFLCRLKDRDPTIGVLDCLGIVSLPHPQQGVHLPCLVVEWCAGTLAGVIGSQDPKWSKLSARMTLAVQVARALEGIHRYGVVHRDMKPENILLTLGGRAILADFGLAKSSRGSRFTLGLGTEYYMSPELAQPRSQKGKSIEHVMSTPPLPADIFAYGRILAALMAHRMPTVEDINENRTLDPGQSGFQTQKVLELIKRCTHVDQFKRPTAADVLQLVTEFAEAPARAAYDLGVEKTKKNEYQAAVTFFEQAAAHGLAQGLYKLGWCYENGVGVAEDVSKATQLYEDAAAQGNPHAQCCLAMCYRLGRNMPVNLKRAIQLYELAALTQEFPRAQFLLGQCYATGVGVSQDPKMAISLYAKAAEKGYGLAQNNLGVCYHAGIGIEGSYKKAIQLFTQASEKGVNQATFNLVCVYRNGLGVNKDEAKAKTILAKAELSEEKVPSTVQEVTFAQEIEYNSFSSKQYRKTTSDGKGGKSEVSTDRLMGLLQQTGLGGIGSPASTTRGMRKSSSANSFTSILTTKAPAVTTTPTSPTATPPLRGRTPGTSAGTLPLRGAPERASVSVPERAAPPPLPSPTERGSVGSVPPAPGPPGIEPRSPPVLPDRGPLFGSGARSTLPKDFRRGAPPPSRAFSSPRKSENMAAVPTDASGSRPTPPNFPPPRSARDEIK